MVDASTKWNATATATSAAAAAASYGGCTAPTAV